MKHLFNYTSVKIKALFNCPVSCCYCAIVCVVVVCRNFFSIYVVALLPCRQQGIITLSNYVNMCFVCCFVWYFICLFVCLFFFFK